MTEGMPLVLLFFLPSVYSPLLTTGPILFQANSTQFLLRKETQRDWLGLQLGEQSCDKTSCLELLAFTVELLLGLAFRTPHHISMSYKESKVKQIVR